MFSLKNILKSVFNDIQIIIPIIISPITREYFIQHIFMHLGNSKFPKTSHIFLILIIVNGIEYRPFSPALRHESFALHKQIF